MELPSTLTMAEAAKLVGTNESAIKKVRLIRTHGADEVVEALEGGDISIRTAAEIATGHPKEEQPAAVEIAKKKKAQKKKSRKKPQAKKTIDVPRLDTGPSLTSKELGAPPPELANQPYPHPDHPGETYHQAFIRIRGRSPAYSVDTRALLDSLDEHAILRQAIASCEDARRRMDLAGVVSALELIIASADAEAKKILDQRRILDMSVPVGTIDGSQS